MKFLIALALFGACMAAEDQKAEDTAIVSTYAAHPNAYGRAYAAYPQAYSGYGLSYPSVYGTYAAPYGYSHGYSTVVHSLKKRDTADAEDQEAEDAFHYSTYAALPYGYAGYAHGYAAPYAYGIHRPLAYTAYPYSAYLG